jgi:hypothetical protein
MNQGFADIISQGGRSAAEAAARAWQNIGAGLAGIGEAAGQYRYSKGHKALVDSGASEDEIRRYNIESWNRGAKTALAPQDYERRDLAEIAERERQRENLIANYNRAISNMRMHDGQATNLLVSGLNTDAVSDAVSESRKQAGIFRNQAGEFRKNGLMLGVPGYMFADLGEGEGGSASAGGEAKESGYVEPSVLAGTAEIFLALNPGTPTKAALAQFLAKEGYSYSDKQKADVLELAKDMRAAQLADEELDYEQEKKKILDARAAQMHALEVAEKKRAAAKGQIETDNAVALNAAQIEWLKNPANREYSATNAAALGQIFKEYKADEKLGGGTLGGMLSSWVNRKANEATRKAEYDAAIKILMGRVPKTDAAPEDAKKTGKSKYAEVL